MLKLICFLLLIVILFQPICVQAQVNIVIGCINSSKLGEGESRIYNAFVEGGKIAVSSFNKVHTSLNVQIVEESVDTGITQEYVYTNVGNAIHKLVSEKNAAILFSLVGNAVSTWARGVMPVHKVLAIGGSGGPRANYDKFLPYTPQFTPAPDIEIVSALRYLLYGRQIRRIAMMVPAYGEYGYHGRELVPLVKKVLKNCGLELVDLYEPTATSDSSASSFLSSDDEAIVEVNQATALARLYSAYPQALLMWGAPTAAGVSALVATIHRLSSLPSEGLNKGHFIIIVSSACPEMLVDVLKHLSIEERKKFEFIIPSSLPVVNDGSLISRNYETDLASYSIHNLIQKNIHSFTELSRTSGYTLMRSILSVIEDAGETVKVASSTKQSEQIVKAFYSSKLFSADDYVGGPFSGDCSGTRSIMCNCSVGSRFVQLLRLNDAQKLEVLPDSKVTIPVGDCSGLETLDLPSPLTQLVVAPYHYNYISKNGSDGAPLDDNEDNPEYELSQGVVNTLLKEALPAMRNKFAFSRRFGDQVRKEYFLGDALGYKGRASTTNSRKGILVESLYPVTKVADHPWPCLDGLIQGEQDSLITVASGSFLLGYPELVVDLAKVPVLLSPMSSLPAPQTIRGFRRNVLYIDATLEQQIHALMGLAKERSFTLSSAIATDVMTDIYNATEFIAEKREVPAPNTIMNRIVELMDKSADTFNVPYIKHQRKNTMREALNALYNANIPSGGGSDIIKSIKEKIDLMDIAINNSDYIEARGYNVAEQADNEDPLAGVTEAVFIFGMSTRHEVRELARFLLNKPHVTAFLPIEHVRAFLPTMRSIIPNSLRRRIICASSLPSWVPPITSPAVNKKDRGSNSLQTTKLDDSSNTHTSYGVPFPKPSATMTRFYSFSTPESRTPAGLLGYLTNLLLQSVTERIPRALSGETFLSTLYLVSTIPIDTDFVIGPLKDTPCQTTDVNELCEMNIGPRTIRVYQLGDGGGDAPSYAGIPLHTEVIIHGRVEYMPRHVEPALQVWMIAVIVVVALIVLIVIGVLLYFFLAKGRNNKAAPKDSNSPFSILFTDVQSSTALWAGLPEAMAVAIDEHHAIIRRLIKEHHGYEVKTIGDAFMIAFAHAADALSLSLALQDVFFLESGQMKVTGESMTVAEEIDRAYIQFDTERIRDDEEPKEVLEMLTAYLPVEDYSKQWHGLRVRIGMHTGFGEIKKDETTGGYDYYGPVVNAAARIESAAHGGQVVASEETIVGAGEYGASIPTMSLGPQDLRGVSGKIVLYQLQIMGRVYPPLRVERKEEEEDDYSQSDRTSQKSSRSNTSSIIDGGPQMAKALQKQQIAELQKLLECFLESITSLMPIKKRKDELKKMADIWRLNSKKLIKVAKTRAEKKQKEKEENDDDGKTPNTRRSVHIASFEEENAPLDPKEKRRRELLEQMEKRTGSTSGVDTEIISELVLALAKKLAPVIRRRMKRDQISINISDTNNLGINPFNNYNNSTMTFNNPNNPNFNFSASKGAASLIGLNNMHMNINNNHALQLNTFPIPIASTSLNVPQPCVSVMSNPLDESPGGINNISTSNSTSFRPRGSSIVNIAQTAGEDLSQVNYESMISNGCENGH